MTVLTKELRQMASEKKIPNRSYMNRAQLLEANQAYDAGEPLPEFIRQPKKVKAPKTEVAKTKKLNDFDKWCLKTATDEAISFSAAKKLGHLYKAEMARNGNTSEDMAKVDADITEE